MIVLIAAISVVVIGLLVFIIKAAAAPKKVDSVRRLLKQGKNQAAAKVAKQIIAKDPKNYLAHYYLGKA
ncbi:MAG: restriction endonuclease, partial [Treponema porcinum]|nr:restriction endonuclease [Treponema porcinum]